MVFEKTVCLLARQFGVDAHMITRGTSLSDDLKADRLDCVELFMALEEEFEIDVDDCEIDSIKTVDDILRLVESKI